MQEPSNKQPGAGINRPPIRATVVLFDIPSLNPDRLYQKDQKEKSKKYQVTPPNDRISKEIDAIGASGEKLTL